MILVSLAFAGTVQVDGASVRVDGNVVASFPTPPKAAAETEGRLYVLTSEGTLETWTVSPPSRVSVMPAPDAVDVFVTGGQAWVTIRETTAVPLDRYTRTAAPAATIAVAPTPTLGGGRVTSAANGTAVIDLGRKAGLSPGTELRFFGTSKQGEMGDLETVVATGRVRVVDDLRAAVDIARGGRVSVGDRVEVRDGAWTYPAAPERYAGVRELGVIIRPVLPLNTLGVAFVNDAWFIWAFDTPWYTEVRVSPLAFGWSKDGNPITVAGTLAGGYDSRYFSVGLGAGWSMYNGDISVVGATAPEYDGGGAGFKDVDNAFAVVQQARLGARDGLNIEVRNTFLLVPEYRTSLLTDENGEPILDEYGYEQYESVQSGSSFSYGGLAMRVNVPTGARTDLFADWSFGSAGAIVVEGGVSTWVRGNGDRGSIGLQVGAGYGDVEGSPDDTYVNLGGPMVSIGGRYRF